MNVPKVCYRKIGMDVRVGREDWPGDAFIVVTNEEFATFEKIMERLSIHMHNWEDDDEEAQKSA